MYGLLGNQKGRGCNTPPLAYVLAIYSVLLRYHLPPIAMSLVALWPGPMAALVEVGPLLYEGAISLSTSGVANPT